MKLTFSHPKLLFILPIILVVGISKSLAQGAKPACPTVRVSSPDQVAVGQVISFTANVIGGDAMVSPTYNWSVSAGSISSGQGTPSITVETDNLGGQSITATVDIGGYARECSSSNSSTTSVMSMPSTRKLDEYGAIKFEDEKARLDNFAIALQMDPTAAGFIITYGGRRGQPKEAQVRSDRAKKYLTLTRGMANDRLTTVIGGYREEATTELYIVPTGGNSPNATPTVDPSEVKMMKTVAPVKKAVPVKKTTTKTVTKGKNS